MANRVFPLRVEESASLPPNDLRLARYGVAVSAWKKRCAEKRDVIRRMEREALEEDERGETNFRFAVRLSSGH